MVFKHVCRYATCTSKKWLKENLPDQIAPLFTNTFNKEKGIQIHQGEKQVEIKYISQNENSECIFQLIDLAGPSESQKLQQTFDLTVRESEVLVWLARGKSNSEIAIILDISPRTINTHLVQIFRKLGVENRTSAAILTVKKLEQF